MGTPTPYHLLSPRTIVTKIISMKRQEPEPPPPPKIILQPRHRTSPAMWCAAIVCFAFSVLLILAGLVILVVFLTVKPRTPSFDVAHAALNSVYIGSPPPYFNGDMTLTANISNPNRKIGVVIQSGAVELFFRGRLVSAQALPSFAQRRGQFTVLSVHMLSSQVVLPPEVAVELLNQMKSNKILFTIRGTFKVRERFWSWHYTYRMTAICDLELTAPPSGFLVDRRCTTST
ncbi:hypothetical protein CFC21_007138 [Triticum aestivum]|uniref:Late embryogenesis abundant protein LEA-2 subgroup domain-containing protein n=3 Tax=Triticum TaxID=4564 RepID=A0A9R1DDG7_WHEAT|nr:NDR1/HIN1-like protein 26 [Triticum dicoccoides]XP_044405595.1 NDR1/HIN1-like protein 26 [Triticum aestivum]KAF6989851.1 hypothetical protein CFC21_007136 [Triticum aestivum]KAF6989852.1 hypothetical protein CFC21_007138 [Triticum aestivum]VAH18437.1 unnamed protein product [Triticum turgidum subsp. durum]